MPTRQTSGTELTAPAGRAKQLWLLPPPRPFTERFGDAFFRALPREPGVYSYFDGAGRLLYVGKAKNLRQRVGSYRYVHPDRDSRKTWRLVNAVREIRWEICADHAAALLHENRLLREFRPRFNRANVWPWSAVYLGLRADGEELRLRVGRELTPEFEWFGSFKAFAIYAFHALRRLVRDCYGDAIAPLSHFTTNGEREFGFTGQTAEANSWRRFFAGDSRELLDHFEARALAYGSRNLACQNLVLNDLILLEQFYERGPLRNQRMTGAQRLLSPEQMSDWLAVQGA